MMNNDKNNYARYLRKNSTEAEKELWYYLRNRNLNRYKFKRQHPIPPYIVDFICERRKLIIELDGGQHAIHEKYDKKRTHFLESLGYRVIRFWNIMIFEQKETVLEMILQALDQ